MPENYLEERLPDGMTSEQADAHCLVRGRRLCTGDELVRWTHCIMRADPLFTADYPTTAQLNCLGPEPPLRELRDGGERGPYGLDSACEIAAEYRPQGDPEARENPARHAIISGRLLDQPFLRVVFEGPGCGPYVRCCIDR